MSAGQARGVLHTRQPERSAWQIRYAPVPYGRAVARGDAFVVAGRDAEALDAGLAGRAQLTIQIQARVVVEVAAGGDLIAVAAERVRRVALVEAARRARAVRAGLALAARGRRDELEGRGSSSAWAHVWRFVGPSQVTAPSWPHSSWQALVSSGPVSVAVAVVESPIRVSPTVAVVSVDSDVSDGVVASEVVSCEVAGSSPQAAMTSLGSPCKGGP